MQALRTPRVAPTAPTCELIDAQDSLLEQSIEDACGLTNVHGWGIGHVLPDGSLDCERQTDPAPRMLDATEERWAASIRGETDTEHVFGLLVSRLDDRDPSALVEVLGRTVDDIRGWCADEDFRFRGRSMA